jgi:cold shock CspA family protein
METGSVKRLLRNKGYGFITRTANEDVYFDQYSVRGKTFNDLAEGEPVIFKIVRHWGTETRKSPKASYVKSMRLIGR